MHSALHPSSEIADHGPDRSARMGGGLLLLTAAATAVMVFTRVTADADQDTLLESLRAVEENRVLYGISGVARLLSGVALFAAAWLLLRTWIIRDRWASPVVPYLFALSGVSTVLSGASAIVIAVYPAPEISVVNGISQGGSSSVLRLRAVGKRLLVATVAGGRHPQVDRSRLPGHRSGHAVHLGGFRHNPAPHHRRGILPMVAGGWNYAGHRQSRAALRCPIRPRGLLNLGTAP